MPKIVTPRRQRAHPNPYDRSRSAIIARIRAANKKVEVLKDHLETAKAGEEYWKSEYDLIHEVIEAMSKHVKRLLNGFEDSGEFKQEELLLRLRMMNLRM